jgi:hypothetical protein
VAICIGSTINHGAHDSIYKIVAIFLLFRTKL